jgi:hypothetical protein
VSPVVAEVVPYELEMFCAVVTEMGLEDVPPMKPLADATGPVKDVCAMMIPHMRVNERPSACRLLGQSDARDFS